MQTGSEGRRKEGSPRRAVSTPLAGFICDREYASTSPARGEAPPLATTAYSSSTRKNLFIFAGGTVQEASTEEFVARTLLVPLENMARGQAPFVATFSVDWTP